MNNYRFFGLLGLSLALIFLITGCESTPATPISYQLTIEVAGDGAITNESGNTLTTSKRTYSFDRDTVVEIKALPFENSDFLFWAGDSTRILDDSQTILMNRDKEFMAVFGDPDDVFMAGYVAESWGNINVVGYWKALMEFPNLEVYLRDRNGLEKAERFIFDKGVYETNPESGEIIYFQPDTISGSQFIAAIMRVEESTLIEQGEATRYIFVFIDLKGFSALILPDTPTNYDIYKDILNEENNEEFIKKVEALIFDNRDQDIIIGNTVIIYDQF